MWSEGNADISEARNMSVPATPLSFTLTGLKIFTLYRVRIAGFTVIGTGPYSEETIIRTGEGSKLFPFDFFAKNNMNSIHLFQKTFTVGDLESEI